MKNETLRHKKLTKKRKRIEEAKKRKRAGKEPLLSKKNKMSKEMIAKVKEAEEYQLNTLSGY